MAVSLLLNAVVQALQSQVDSGALAHATVADLPQVEHQIPQVQQTTGLLSCVSMQWV